jgi:hypothetical protein
MCWHHDWGSEIGEVGPVSWEDVGIKVSLRAPALLPQFASGLRSSHWLTRIKKCGNGMAGVRWWPSESAETGFSPT